MDCKMKNQHLYNTQEYITPAICHVLNPSLCDILRIRVRITFGQEYLLTITTQEKMNQTAIRESQSCAGDKVKGVLYYHIAVVEGVIVPGGTLAV